jgi:xanthine/uracil/vitamin C permease (AzgA family)
MLGGLWSASSNTTFIVMPVTYSIANGVGVGIVLHTCGEVLMGRP